jgi:hypothetical protein
MKFAGIFKPVNQITDETVRLVTGRYAIKCGWVIFAIRAGKWRSHLPAIRPGTNLAKWSGDPDRRFQTIPAKQPLIQT